MVQELVELFGQTLDVNVDIVAATNNSLFISNTLPPSVIPNGSLNVGVTVRNLGSKAWFTGSNHVLHVNSDVCGLFAQPDHLPTPGEVILTNQSTQFIVFMQAPGTTGPCAFQLQMNEIGSGVFGPVFDGTLVVQTPANAVRDWRHYE